MERLTDDSGWKQIHGDVFRKPSYLVLFSVFYASGCHIAAGLLTVVAISCCFPYYFLHTEGSYFKTIIGAFLLTSAIGGFEGGRVYRLFRGTTWKVGLNSFLIMEQCGDH